MNHAPIGYVYEADAHCPGCAFARFGLMRDDPDTLDAEGNPIGVIAPWDETPSEGEVCGTCGDEISEPWWAAL